MKIKILLSFALFVLLFTVLHSNNSNYPSRSRDKILYCTPELRDCVKAIKKLESGSKLLNSVLQQGSINLSVANNEPSKKFGACWYPDERIIYIDVNEHNTQGEVIGSLVFELFNALRTPKFNQLYTLAEQGKISKESYVRSLELIEYQNSIEAAELIKQGIEKGVFDQSAFLHTYSSFDEHYYYQKASGHSAIHARNYDMIFRR